ncbi:bacterial Ig-like domain-containing protein [Enterococcus faecalis]|uniref:bacterial Ig-like domain-containing protein n=1 Tax=Enterococcus faecalis TaxID=1351 RepID=UPI0030184F74
MSNDTGILPKIINHELSGSSITAKYIDPYEIIIGDSFSNEYPIISAKDELNNDIDFSKFTYAWKYRPPVNPSIVGDWSVLSIYYNFPDGSGGYTRDVTVKVVGKDGRRAELKDTVLYTGQKWDIGSIFKYATDRDGYFINLEKINDVWIDGQKTREIDTSRPGKHSVQIGVSSPRTKPLVVSNVGTVIVKEDQTKAELKDTELYVNQKWDLGSVFKNVVDKDGNPIKPEEINDVWIDGQKTREIDTSKPSKHIVQIAVRSATNDWVYSNKVTVTVEDKSSIKTKNSTRYIGQAWGQIDNFVSATDEEGKNVPFQDSRIRMDGATAVDLSKPGVYKVTYIFDGKFKQVKSESTVTVLEDQTKAELKDTELYVNQKWDLGSVFKNVVDKDGNPIKPEEINDVWIDGQKTREIDTSKPSKHIVQIAVLNAYNEWVYSNEVTVTVKEDKSSIKTKNSTRYIGQEWGQIDNFVSATDEEGKNVPFQDSRIRMDGATAVDLSKPGVYKVTYIFDGKFKQVKSESTVTVLEDQTKAELKDTELYASQKWDLGSVFKNVVDKDGNPIKPEEINGVWIDGQKTREIDTSKPGKHTVKIAVLNAYNEWVYSNEVTVTVKEPFTIKQVPYFDFEDHILVSTNKSVVNKKENPTIELETPSIEGKDWQLQVELSPFLDKKNSKSVLKGVSLFIPKGRLESDLATEEPTQYDCQLEANGKASILMHGTKTKGKGRWKNKLATKEITLSIPPENKKGNYESTLHWTLLDVP